MLSWPSGLTFRPARTTLRRPSKVRLVAAVNGHMTVTAAPVGFPSPARVGLAAAPVASDHTFLFFKTTQRQVYDAAQATRPDCDETILWNERGELTEAGSANLVLSLGGRRLTPPVTSGLLAGRSRPRKFWCSTSQLL